MKQISEYLLNKNKAKIASDEYLVWGSFEVMQEIERQYSYKKIIDKRSVYYWILSSDEITKVLHNISNFSDSHIKVYKMPPGYTAESLKKDFRKLDYNTWEQYEINVKEFE